MSTYHRAYQAGGCYFFTVVTHRRHPILIKPAILERLLMAFRNVQVSRPFSIDAMVVLPDHFHCIWQLPPDEHDFSTRLRLVKHYVSSGIDVSFNDRKEKMVWQRRFWEHLIRN